MGLGIICSGQGNQSREMFAKLANLPELSQSLSELGEELKLELVPDINLTDEQLFANNYAQPLIAGLSYLQWQYLASKLSQQPVAFAGYSLGELSSYACAGACDFTLLINLARVRANLMENAASQFSEPSGLLAVSGIIERELNLLCQEFSCFIAIQNSLDNWVIGGLNSALASLQTAVQLRYPSLKLTPLNVAVASHTPLLKLATEQYNNYLSNTSFHSLSSPVIASVNHQTIYNIKDGLPLLSRQISETFHFNKTVEVMYEMGANVILEIGCGNALSKIMSNLHLPIKVRSVNDFSSLDGAITWVNKNLDA